MMGSLFRQGLGPLLVFALMGSGLAAAEVKTKAVEYEHDGVTLTGWLAWDDAAEGKRPGVLVVHEWWGLNDYAKSRAEQLAAEGYVAFALDMYGDDKVTKHPDEASTWMKAITANVDVWTARAEAGLAVLKSQDQVDGAKLAAIGYCFGGSTVLQLAYAGADLDAVASFHGSLPPAPDGAAASTRVFAAHGRDDAFVPAERITSFQDSLDKAGIDWEMLIYSGTRHSFTNPGAGAYGIDNLAYNPRADENSWAAMKQLFDEVF